ncbi:helix-turn-helix domain-containing protein [Microvirga flavescens]|uniref:helix-turn-helix domain-containing protein n=1 Tax=Microvirga flavescens TaxID=2249811 RepID=UPI000DD93C67|nr:helix-turn-helix transcriptional regulator [Microvirga flavescens]
MDVRQKIGENVRQLRLDANLTQQEVADRIGVDRAHISALEAGNRNPTIVTLWHLALALDIEITALFRDFPSRPDSDTLTRKRASKRRGPRRTLNDKQADG